MRRCIVLLIAVLLCVRCTIAAAEGALYQPWDIPFGITEEEMLLRFTAQGMKLEPFGGTCFWDWSDSEESEVSLLGYPIYSMNIRIDDDLYDDILLYLTSSESEGNIDYSNPIPGLLVCANAFLKQYCNLCYALADAGFPITANRIEETDRALPTPDELVALAMANEPLDSPNNLRSVHFETFFGNAVLSGDFEWANDSCWSTFSLGADNALLDPDAEDNDLF